MRVVGQSERGGGRNGLIGRVRGGSEGRTDTRKFGNTDLSVWPVCWEIYEESELFCHQAKY